MTHQYVEGRISRASPPYTDLRHHMELVFANQRAGLMAEFYALSEFEAALADDDSLWYSAKLPVNQPRNRYADILANEPTRVRLAAAPGQSDYINANLVPGAPFGVGQGYIVAQAPMPGTVEHWWTMIWEQQVGLIIMLANLVELGEPKVHPYWPQSSGRRRAVRFGRYTIQMTAEVQDSTSPQIVRRMLVVQCDGVPETRTVDVYHFTGWPDRGVPTSTAPLLRLLALMDQHQRPGPILLHCSAGVGRSGVMLTAHLITSMARQHMQSHGPTRPYPYNVLTTICRLRRFRNGLVQTPDQLALCYALILQAAEAMPGSADPAAGGSMYGGRPSSPLSPVYQPLSPLQPPGAEAFGAWSGPSSPAIGDGRSRLGPHASPKASPIQRAHHLASSLVRTVMSPVRQAV